MREKNLFLITFTLLTLSCEPANQKGVIHEYDEIKDISIKYDEVFLQKEDSYYIYYYSINCYHCHGLKSRIISYALENSSFYFVEVNKDFGSLSSNKIETIGATDPYYAFANMTPQLSKVDNKKIVETYIGDIEIIEALNL